MAQVKDKDLLSVQEARDLLSRAERAGELLSQFTQEQVDRLVGAMAEAVRAEAGRLAELAVEETGRGKVCDKTTKNLFSAIDIYGYIRDLKTCGIISENKERGVVEIAVPVGVIAAIAPTSRSIPGSRMMLQGITFPGLGGPGPSSEELTIVRFIAN